jgi:hypothetical protein
LTASPPDPLNPQNDTIAPFGSPLTNADHTAADHTAAPKMTSVHSAGPPFDILKAFNQCLLGGSAFENPSVCGSIPVLPARSCRAPKTRSNAAL